MKRPGNGWGGARPGGGKPKGYKSQKVILAAQARADLQNKIMGFWDELVEAKRRLALGEYAVIGKDGVPQITGWISKDGKMIPVYDQKPDSKSIDFLLEMAAGKATQPVENSGTINNPAMAELADSLKQIAQISSGKK